MIGRIVVVLLCLGLALAPAAAADSDGGQGSCVWTSREGSNVRAGYDLDECSGTGGIWSPTPA